MSRERREPPLIQRFLDSSGRLLHQKSKKGAPMKQPRSASEVPRSERRVTVTCGRGHFLAVVRHDGLLFVEGVILGRLARPDAAALLTPDVDLDALRAEKVELSDRRDGLAELLADGLLSRERVTEQASRLTRRVAALDARITAAVGDSPVGALVDADDVAAAWEALDMRSRKAVVDLLLLVTVLPAGKGQRFDPEQVRIEWRTS